MSNKGYHSLKIVKHNYGSPFKLIEESLEYLDALSNGNKIMALVELADLFGALEEQANKLGVNTQDLKIMSDVTKRSFVNKRRNNLPLFDYLKDNANSILEFGLGFIQVKLQNVNFNFYTKKIEKFTDDQSPHSHQQDFVSEILTGELKEKLYSTQDGSLSAYCGCGDTTLKLDNVGYVYLGGVIHKKGDLYCRLKNEYHTVSATNNTVTKVFKVGDKVDAFVFGEKHEYETYKTEEELWEIVKEICNEEKL